MSHTCAMNAVYHLHLYPHELVHRQLHPILVWIFHLFNFTIRKFGFSCKLTSWDLNRESSSFFMAYFISSYRRNSTTPVPSLCTSAKHTSPASRIWSFKSCQDPLKNGIKSSKFELAHCTPLTNNNQLCKFEFNSITLVVGLKLEHDIVNVW